MGVKCPKLPLPTPECESGSRWVSNIFRFSSKLGNGGDPNGLDDGDEDEDEDEDDNQAIRRFQLPSYSSGGLPPLKSWWQVNSFDDHDPGDDDYIHSREDEDQNFTLWGFGDPHLSRIGWEILW